MQLFLSPSLRSGEVGGGFAYHRRCSRFTPLTPAYNLRFTPYGRVHGQCTLCPYGSSLLGTFSLSVNNTSTNSVTATPNSTLENAVPIKRPIELDKKLGRK